MGGSGNAVDCGYVFIQQCLEIGADVAFFLLPGI